LVAETDGETDCEPNQPHGHLGWERFPASLTEGLRLRAPERWIG
jgi:hypothetical protein